MVVLLVGGCGSAAPSPVRIPGEIVHLTPGEVTIRDASFLTDGAADAAARAEQREATRDFWLRLESTTRTFRVDPASAVTVIGYDAAGYPSPMPFDVARLSEVVGNLAAQQVAGLHSGDYFWLTLRGDQVVRFDAQDCRSTGRQDSFLASLRSSASTTPPAASAPRMVTSPLADARCVPNGVLIDAARNTPSAPKAAAAPWTSSGSRSNVRSHGNSSVMR